MNFRLSFRGKLNLFFFSDGVFNKDYDRQLVKKVFIIFILIIENIKSFEIEMFFFQSFINFLKDPKGDMPWEEDETAKDVAHLNDEAVIITIKSLFINSNIYLY